MPNFTYDRTGSYGSLTTSTAYPKLDDQPMGSANPQTHVSSSEWNAFVDSLLSLSYGITSGSLFGFVRSTVAPTSSVGSATDFLWLDSNGNLMQHKKNVTDSFVSGNVSFGSVTASYTQLIKYSIFALTQQVTMSFPGNIFAVSTTGSSTLISPGPALAKTGSVQNLSNKTIVTPILTGSVSGDFSVSSSFRIRKDKQTVVIPRNGLIGEWKLDDNLLDTSAFGNHASASGGSYIDAKFSRGVFFNGTSEFVSLGTNSLYAFDLTSSFSVSAIIKTPSLATNRAIIGNSWLGPGWHLRVTSGGVLRFIVVNAGGTAYTYVDSNTTLGGGWYHVAATYNGSSSMAVFVNGVNDSAAKVSAGNIGTIASTGSVRIGNVADVTTPFSGTIDQVRIYNRVLAGDEIRNLSAETAHTQDYCLRLENLTPATSGSNKPSPALNFYTQALHSTASVSQNVKASIQVNPIQRASDPDAALTFYTSVNNGPLVERLNISSTGITASVPLVPNIGTKIIQPQWINVLYQNNYTNFGNGYPTSSFWKDPAGTVYLRLAAAGGTNGAVICTLPAGYRPGETLIVPGYVDTPSAANCWFRIKTNGDVLCATAAGTNAAILNIFWQAKL